MYSDDEETGFGGCLRDDRDEARQLSKGGVRDRSRSRGGRSPRRRSPQRRSRSRSRGKGGDRVGGKSGGKGDREGKGKGKAGGRSRTTGREMPKLNSVHKATVASIQSYGCFVKLGDGSTYKDGLLHISRISSSGRLDAVTDVLAEGDHCWVKVCEVDEDKQKHSLDMRFVRQRDGEDMDPNNTQADSGRGGKGGGKPDPIRIGAVQDTVCTRCGAKGHMARECFAAKGNNYAMIEGRDSPPAGREKSPDRMAGVETKVVKAALREYLARKAAGGGASDSSDDKKTKKDKKEEKKAKKAMKKEKKALKKAKKKDKKEKKKDKKAQKKVEKEKEKKEKEKDKEQEVDSKKEVQKEEPKKDEPKKESKKDKEKEKEKGKEKEKEKEKEKTKEKDKKHQKAEKSKPAKTSGTEEVSLANLLGGVSSGSSSSSSSSSS